MKNNLKQHMGYWLNRARNRVHLAFEHRLSVHDITVAQWCILIAMYDQKANSVKELACYIDVDKASVSRVVERLVSKGLVFCSKGKDRRSGELKLTEIGTKILPQLLQEAEKNEKYFFDTLTEEEQSVLLRALEKINMIGENDDA